MMNTEPTVINVENLFLDFKGMVHVYANSPKANAKNCLYLGMMCGEDSKWLMIYLLDNWYAWLMCVVDGNYKYINLTEMIYQSWLENKNSRKYRG